jgi:hypothetical protein
MDQYVDTAYDVTSQLFGSESGIPWWAWGVVLVAVFFKLLVPQRQTAEERDTMLAEAVLDGTPEDSGKKRKKSSKKK